MATLSPDQWQQVEPYLDEALEMVPEQRAAWLLSLREKDAGLASVLQALLEKQQQLRQEGFLESSPLPASGGLAGQSIGAYTLVTQPRTLAPEQMHERPHAMVHPVAALSNGQHD